MKKLILLLFLPVAALAQDKKEFKIKGTINTARPVDWIYLVYGSGDNVTVDSLQPEDGSYKFEGELAEPMLASLRIKYKQQAGEQRPRLESTSVFLEPGKITVAIKDSVENITVQGSPMHQSYLRLREELRAFDEKLNPLYEAYEAANEKGDKEAVEQLVDKILDVEDERREKVYRAFALKHSNSPVGLYAARQYAGWSIDPARVEPVFNALSPEIKQLPSAVAFKNEIELAKKTAVGSYAMDFTQNDTLGRPVSLSSFKGSYVLVDFWASWCGPCRKENPNLVKAFHHFKERNFTVLGVSLDRPGAQEKWMAAIHKDGLAWTQVSDLQFWDNAVARQYGIRSIPQNLLLDPQGKIIAKNLRGKELFEKLDELLPE